MNIKKWYNKIVRTLLFDVMNHQLFYEFKLGKCIVLAAQDINLPLEEAYVSVRLNSMLIQNFH